MSAVNHTPGPWVVNENPAAMSAYCILAESRGTGFGASVATANQREGYNSLSHEEAMANARLIAAAPELLEALQTVADRIPDLIAHGILDFKDTDAIRAAIAKAGVTQ